MFITPPVIASFSRYLLFVTELCKIIKELEQVPPILMKYTDGGTDQRKTLDSVKVASICLFKELDLNFMIAARCASRRGYMNPAERIISIYTQLGTAKLCNGTSPLGCEKPQIVCSKNKLNHNQRMLLAKSISCFEYSRGAFLFPFDIKFKIAGILCIRPSLQCAMQIEFPYYGLDASRADKCSHCGGNNAVVRKELK